MQELWSIVLINLAHTAFLTQVVWSRMINNVKWLSGSEVRWNFVHGLFENAIYGGRVDNAYDLNVLKSYLRQYFEADIITGGQVVYSFL